MLSDKTKNGNIEVPNTTDDQEDLATWKHGQEVKGTFAKMHGGFSRYRDDINRAWGKENEYKNNTVYINTMKLVSEELKKYK